MTIAIRGGDSVNWYRHAPAAFPYIKASIRHEWNFSNTLTSFALAHAAHAYVVPSLFVSL